MEGSTSCRSGATKCTEDLINKIEEIQKTGRIDIVEKEDDAINDDEKVEEVESFDVEEDDDVLSEFDQEIDDEIDDDNGEIKNEEEAEIDDEINVDNSEIKNGEEETEIDDFKESSDEKCWKGAFGFRCCKGKKQDKFGKTINTFWCDHSQEKKN